MDLANPSPPLAFCTPHPSGTSYPSLPDQQDARELKRGCRVPYFAAFCAWPRNARPPGVRWMMKERLLTYTTGDSSNISMKVFSSCVHGFCAVRNSASPKDRSGFHLLQEVTSQHVGFPRWQWCLLFHGPSRHTACVLHAPRAGFMGTLGFGRREDAGKWRRQGQDEEQSRTGPGHVSPTTLSDVREMGKREASKGGVS